MSPLYAAVEAGGTKVIAALMHADGRVVERTRVATRDPAGTLGETRDFLEAAAGRHGRPVALGIASFGPIDLDPRSPRHGWITSTPKPGWRDTPLDTLWPAAWRKADAPPPIAIDTDVNAAALAEQQRGAGRGCDTLAYITVGTGIGVGVVAHGRPLHGLLHPEAGHLWPRRHPEDAFAGTCPFHADCFEGLASGPAILARCGASLDALPATHPMWRIEADYLGQLAAQILLLVSPQRLVVGGGVMQQAALFPALRERLRHWLGGYVQHAAVDADIDGFVVPPGLGNDAGLVGALLLALQAAPPR